MNTAQANVVEFRPAKKKPKKKKLGKGFWEMPNGKYKLDARDQNGERFRRRLSARLGGLRSSHIVELPDVESGHRTFN